MQRRSFLRSLMGATATIVVAPAAALAEVHRWLPMPQGRYLEAAHDPLYMGAAGGGKSNLSLMTLDEALKSIYSAPLEQAVSAGSELLALFDAPERLLEPRPEIRIHVPERDGNVFGPGVL